MIANFFVLISRQLKNDSSKKTTAKKTQTDTGGDAMTSHDIYSITFRDGLIEVDEGILDRQSYIEDIIRICLKHLSPILKDVLISRLNQAEEQPARFRKEEKAHPHEYDVPDAKLVLSVPETAEDDDDIIMHEEASTLSEVHYYLLALFLITKLDI